MSDHQQRIVDLIQREFNYNRLEQITPETTIEQLELDSLDRAELCMDVEHAFDIEISNTEMEAVTTVQELIDLVGKLPVITG